MIFILYIMPLKACISLISFTIQINVRGIKIRKFFTYLLFFSFFVHLGAQDDFTVNKIHFKGNKTLSSSLLKKQLTIKAKTLPQRLAFWKDRILYNDGHLEHDIRDIKTLYQKEGFLNVDIRVKKHPAKKESDVNLSFVITENTPVLTGKVRFLIYTDSEGGKNDIDSLINEQKNLSPLQEGTRFRDAEVEDIQIKITKLLMDHGYPDPEIQYDLYLKNNEHLVDVEYSVITGMESKLGEIRISGNEYIDENLIQKQLSIKPGDLFSQSELEKNQSRVQQLGVFEFVSVKNILREKDKKSNTLPIEIHVRELPRWSVKTGAGYGIDERIRLSTTIRRQPFLGNVRYAILTLKYSYLEPYHINLKITQPAILTPQSTLSLNPFARKEHEKAYDLERFGISTTLRQNLSVYSQTFINYTFERNQLELNENVTDVFILTNTYYNKSKISWGISTDHSTPLFFPDKGFFASLLTTFSGLPGSEYHYVSALTDIRKFQRISDRLVLATRLKTGMMKAVMGDRITPIEERFYAGGSNSIRGFLRNDLSPKNENDISVGGNSYLEASLEFRERIFKSFYGVLFMDLGNVWEEYNSFDLTNLAWAPGIGIRFSTPIGPLRFDVAYPLDQPDGKIRFHFSFGQAF
jgi:outer membrane protein assembly complex protein YaeT